MNELTQEVCAVVERALLQVKQVPELSGPLVADSSMDTIAEWDSLAFLSVFLEISAHFEIDVDQDDAVQFTSVEGIVELIEEIRGEE